MTCGLFMSNKRITGFTHMHLPLVSDYLRVLRARQDSLASIQLLLTSIKLHDRSYLRVFSTHQQSPASSVLLVSHEPNTQVVFQNFFRYNTLLTCFCKLGRDLYCICNTFTPLKRSFCSINVMYHNHSSPGMLQLLQY